MSEKKEQFIVDAAALQELGERLIGRPEIALGELVKNSFDADATIARIEFGEDQIVISDNGTGISEQVFLDYWMRLFTTHKIEQGTSDKFLRPLTGSKGIGRLSAQFLAHEMTLESTSLPDGDNPLLWAFIDWDSAKRGERLETVEVLWEPRDDPPHYPAESQTGTQITLKRLKNLWDRDAIEALGKALWTLRSPFKQLTKDTRSTKDAFEIAIEAPGITGAKAAFNATLQKVLSNWQARVQGNLENGRSGNQATISVDFRADYPKDSPESRFEETVSLPLRKTGDPKSNEVFLVDSAKFQILIFKAAGKQPGGIEVADLRRYLADFGNVSVYDAGFRLPYYGASGDKSAGKNRAGEDWLFIAADQGRRLSTSELLPERLQMQNQYMLDLPAPRRILGAVEIATNHEHTTAKKDRGEPQDWLEIQPGRDRLKDNQAFAQLRDLVRYSLDFYANRYRLRLLNSAEKRKGRVAPRTEFDRAIDTLDRNREEIPDLVFKEVRSHIVTARKTSVAQAEVVDSRAVLLAPLASAGMAALALNHEIARERNSLNRMSARLRQIATKHSISELENIAEDFANVQQRLDALRELFAPLLTDIDKNATGRLRVREVVEQAVSAMRPMMPGVRFDPSNIPGRLLFPLGSLAEWIAVLQNVLANAWNAMLDSDRYEISFSGGKEKSGNEWLRISDTGQGLGVSLNEAPGLFEPFERRLEISEDKRSIVIGGQGLGLAIVRMIAHRRLAKASFVEPEVGFSTTLEIAWKGVRK